MGKSFNAQDVKNLFEESKLAKQQALDVQINAKIKERVDVIVNEKIEAALEDANQELAALRGLIKGYNSTTSEGVVIFIPGVETKYKELVADYCLIHPFLVNQADDLCAIGKDGKPSTNVICNKLDTLSDYCELSVE